jgi:predicted aspartyl protease
LLDGRIVVPVTIAGHKLWFLLDTGGTRSTIKWEVAKELDLAVKQSVQGLKGVGGSLLNFNATVENVSLGDLSLKPRQFYIETRSLPFADGTLASDILRDYGVEVDLDNGTLSLTPPNYCTESAIAGIAVDIAQDGHVRLPVRLDGKTIIAAFDTGAANSLMPMSAASQLGIYPNSSALKPVGDVGPYRLYEYPFQSLEIGDVSVKSPPIRIATDGLIPGTESVMILGMDTFQPKHFLIGYTEKRLFILPDSHPASEHISGAGHQLAAPP